MPTGDQFFSDVSLLLHFDGSNASTSFPDTSSNPKTVTAAGATQLSTAQKEFGSASVHFGGSGDYATVANDAQLDLVGVDFTVEAWVRLTAYAASGNTQIVSKDATGSAFPSYALSVTPGGKLNGVIGNSGGTVNIQLVTGTTTIALNTWTAVAMTRSGSTVRIFVGGVLDGNFTQSITMVDSARGVTLANSGSLTSSDYLNGYIDELRITKGVARYTGTYTPDTSAFPDQGLVASGFLATNHGTPTAVQAHPASGFLATHYGTPVCIFSRYVDVTGLSAINIGSPRLITIIGQAGGWNASNVGTPVLIPSALGFLASRYGVGSVHATVTADASGFAAEQLGTPSGHGVTYHNAAALAPTSNVGTPTTPTERYTQAHGFDPVHVGDPVALIFVPPDLDQLADATGVLAFDAGTPTVSTAVSVAATGANAFHSGTPVARPTVACAAAGVAAVNVGTPASQMIAHARGFRSPQFGTPTCARIFQAVGRAPQTRYGTPTYSRGTATHFAASAGLRSRFGRPRGFRGTITVASGFLPTQFGSPAAFEHHRVSALPPNTRFGTPLLRRNPLC